MKRGYTCLGEQMGQVLDLRFDRMQILGRNRAPQLIEFQARLDVKLILIVLFADKWAHNICLLALFKSSAQRAIGDITVCIGKNARCLLYTSRGV